MDENIPKSWSTTGAAIASTNLASHWRTIRGALDEMDLRGMKDAQIRYVLQQAGLPVSAMHDPDFPISIRQDWQMLHMLLQNFSDGLHPATRIFQHAERFEITVMGLLGLAMKHAPDFGTAARITTEYPQLTWGRCRLDIHRQGDTTRLRYNLLREDLADWPDQDFELLKRHALTADLGGAIRIIDGISNEMLQPMQVHFTFSRPDDWHLVEDKIPYPVFFDAAETCLVYQGDIASWPMPAYNRRAFRTFMNAVERSAGMLKTDDTVSEQVLRWLWASPQLPGRPEIARLVNLSERSLNRKLKEEGTNFRALCKQVRLERAKNLLTDPTQTIAQISWQLGYAEPQAFTLAFRNWTGQTPSGWRKTAEVK